MENFGETEEAFLQPVRKVTLTPKAVLHQKYGEQACYEIEEVKESLTNGCPGLAIPCQTRTLFRCHLKLPELTVTSDTFTRKKEAEQTAAKMALEKLGIDHMENNRIAQDPWDEIVSRISWLFSDKFLRSSHPLVGHFRDAILRDRNCPSVPISVLPAFDGKLNNLCKFLDPKLVSDPLLNVHKIVAATRLSDSICIPEGNLVIKRKIPYSSETIEELLDRYTGPTESIQIEVIHIPYLPEKNAQSMVLNVPSNYYYMDAIAQKLGAKDSSNILVSRAVGKSSVTRFYFLPPEVLLSSESSYKLILETSEMEAYFNAVASYFTGQSIYGDAILAAVGYPWRSPNIFYEDISLTNYYKMYLDRIPDGNYKSSRGALLAAELPTSFSTATNWKGSYPRDLLSTFCHKHQLSEPVFLFENLKHIDTFKEMTPTHSDEGTECVDMENNMSTDANPKGIDAPICGVQIHSREEGVMLECFPKEKYASQNHGIQNLALRVLLWLNDYFEQQDMSVEKLLSFGEAHGINANPHIMIKELGPFLFIQTNLRKNILGKYSTSSLKENEIPIFNIEGLDSGILPSYGSSVCISYVVSLIKDKQLKVLESSDEFEFEVGNGAVIHQLEACVLQMSVNQTAWFITGLPSINLLLCTVGELTEPILPLESCSLKYSMKLLRVIEPLECRMEQALFSPPLSKQRVEHAVKLINDSRASTLIDFGCGSGSLLDSLLDHKTCLKKIVGVDISIKSLGRAAKTLHSKLRKNSNLPVDERSFISSIILFDGSILELDSRLYNFDIGTCLEVIEHIEEDDAYSFGDIVLSSFCPKILVVSTPNYEYNPLLQRTTYDSIPNEQNQSLPCKFRNHDHKFEWTREQFKSWATSIALKHKYEVEFSGVGGSEGIEPGFASQIAVFRRNISESDTNPPINKDSSHPYNIIWAWNDVSTAES